VRGEQGAVARFVLVRHGEAEGNRELRYLGSTDAPLTPRGGEQARQLAAGLRPYRVAAIYSSPLLRARATAQAIGDALGLEPRVEERLREARYGAWENLTRDEARARDPELLAAWEAGADVAPPDGERLEAVRGRALAAVEEWTTAHAGQVVALVSHVGPIKALLCAALGLPASGSRRMWLDPASICVVDWRIVPAQGSSGLVRVMNSIAHLESPVRWLDSVR
jgi:broad specificity phosphatase PhoE